MLWQSSWRYRKGMLRYLYPPFLVLALSACTGFGSAKSFRPESPPEMRAAAASFMKTEEKGRKDVSEKPTPSFILKPSPGKETLVGQHPIEVLTPDPWSGAYVAFVSQVPPTRYFQVLGQADCNDWVYLQLMNSDMLKNRPNYYGGGNYTGDKPAFKCLGLVHKRFRDKSDQRLFGSDGVIFDVESATLTDVDGWFIQNVKIRMDGWAIKFVAPTFEEIKIRLNNPPTSPVEVLQIRAAAYWVKENKATQFTEDLRRLLYAGVSRDYLRSWGGTGRSILNALASIEDSSEPDDLYRSIMESGISEMLRPGSLSTVGVALAFDTPYIAANVILCRNQPGSRELFRKVLLKATVSQHKLAAAQALVDSGDTEFLLAQLHNGRLGDVSNHVTMMLTKKHVSPFVCPYPSNNRA